jgi:hypothetical protein
MSLRNIILHLPVLRGVSTPLSKRMVHIFMCDFLTVWRHDVL